MVRREDLLREEDEAFAGFLDEVRRLGAERGDEPVLPGGWSVRDLLWHVACWCAECASALERIRLGTYRGWEEDVDALNARFLEEGRRHDAATGRAMLAAARNRMLQELALLPEEPPREAVEWFRESGVQHYREHLEDVRAARMRGPGSAAG
ncbi:MAG TPA: maleylpyruvate isomerase N-terminal domain-containing protein [Actinomycetota bacterium]|nr:maleylpyruvate isomerase N-terminal domain-containing protein [Actinomycetota bacterium]